MSSHIKRAEIPMFENKMRRVYVDLRRNFTALNSSNFIMQILFILFRKYATRITHLTILWY
jgi:hypothetical protein